MTPALAQNQDVLVTAVDRDQTLTMAHLQSLQQGMVGAMQSNQAMFMQLAKESGSRQTANAQAARSGQFRQMRDLAHYLLPPPPESLDIPM